MFEYFFTRRSLCGDDDFRIMEAKFKNHHIVRKKLSPPIFDSLAYYAFQKTLIQKHIPSFRSIKQIRFTVAKKVCMKCDQQTILNCFWCQLPLCFTKDYIHRRKQQ